MLKIKFQGGLGNQMFQYAFMKTLERLLNEKMYIDLTEYKMSKCHNGFELFNVFQLKDENLNINSEYSVLKKFILKLKRSLNKRCKKFFKNGIKIEEDTNKILNFENIKKETKKHSDIEFIGYWQSEEYFIHIKDEILEIFTFKNKLDKENEDILEKIKNSNSVSLHIRRGDYLKYSDIYVIQDKNYYVSSIEKIKEKIENPTFFIFSDDIDWCKNNLVDILGENYYFVDNNKDEKSYIDMQLMSNCKHNIIANSSFSWWGAWLNRNEDKMVIAPKKWYKEGFHVSTKHLIPKKWIKN